jgi:hypothetical protein
MPAALVQLHDFIGEKIRIIGIFMTMPGDFPERKGGVTQSA